MDISSQLHVWTLVVRCMYLQQVWLCKVMKVISCFLSSFCLILLLLLLLLLSVLPGSFLTTDLALDALARVLQLLPSVRKTLHYSTLVIVQPTTVQVKKQIMDHVHTLHTTILLLLTMSSTFNCQRIHPYLMSSCVVH